MTNQTLPMELDEFPIFFCIMLFLIMVFVWLLGNSSYSGDMVRLFDSAYNYTTVIRAGV